VVTRPAAPDKEAGPLMPAGLPGLMVAPPQREISGTAKPKIGQYVRLNALTALHMLTIAIKREYWFSRWPSFD
jgi:hypothetical protein